MDESAQSMSGWSSTQLGKWKTMIRNIIFDWSGTLVDDLPAVWRTTNHILERAGKSAMTLDEFRLEFTLPFARFYQNYLPEFRIEELEVWWHEFFPGVEHLVEPLPGSREFLEFAKSREIRTFICSAIHYNQFATQSERSGFMHLIDTPYIEIKDKTERIHHILEENELVPDETLFIGDMEHDIHAAQAGGVHSCAVLTGYNGLQQLREARPDLIVENLAELKRILQANHFKLPPTCDLYAPDAAGVEDSGAGGVSRFPLSTVGALIFDESGRVLMIQTHKWSDLWGIPGGKIQLNESAPDALVREIREETALEVNNIEFVMVQDCINSPEFYKPAHFLLLNYTARVVGETCVKLNDEAQDFCWVPLGQALEMPLNHPTRVLLEAVMHGDTSSQTSRRVQSIHIAGLEIQVSLGVPDWERSEPQTILIDLEFELEGGQAACSDDLDDTLNYAEVVGFIRHFASGGSWKLLERFVDELLSALMSQFPLNQGSLKATKHVIPGTHNISLTQKFSR